MWEIYRIGLSLGLGIAIGLLLCGLLAPRRALVFAGVAFVPFLGYLEVAAVPALAARARRRRPDRYAGLRTLARD